MAATHTTAVAAWHAYTIDYNTYRLGEYANIDTDAHSRDRGVHNRDDAVGARAAAALLAHSTWTAWPKAALEGRAARRRLIPTALPHARRTRVQSFTRTRCIIQTCASAGQGSRAVGSGTGRNQPAQWQRRRASAAMLACPCRGTRKRRCAEGARHSSATHGIDAASSVGRGAYLPALPIFGPATIP